MCVSIGRIAAENKQEKTGKEKCDATRCESLLVTERQCFLCEIICRSGFANTCEYRFSSFLMIVFEHPIQILFRIQ